MCCRLCFSNAEGEEYLRQRRLQLPFSCTTGEAILYNTGPIMDISQFQFDKVFDSKDTKKDMPPASLLDCILSQDETMYTQTMDTPLPVDQVFMDSRALVSFASSQWKENNSSDITADPVLVKEEGKQSVIAVIDSLEKLTQGGDFEDVLQNLEVDDADLIGWENCFKRLRQEEGQQRNSELDLDNLITDEIADFIDSVFKERGEECLNSLASSCLTEGNNLSSSELCDPQLFHTPGPGCSYSPVSFRYPHLKETGSRAGISGQSPAEYVSMGSGNQKLSNQVPLGAQTDSSLPPVQQLQLHDIFSPAIELPELTVPNISASDAFPAIPSFQQVSIRPASLSQAASVQGQQPERLLQPGNSLVGPRLGGAGQVLQNSPQQMSNTGAPIKNMLPPMVPANHFTSSNTSTVAGGYDPNFLQKGMIFENHNATLQQYPQSQQQRRPHAGIVQNGHETICAIQKNSGNQIFPSTVFCQGSVSRPNHNEQGVLAGSQVATHINCMFQQHFSSHPAGGNVLSYGGLPDLNAANVSLDQQPRQGSCFIQRGRKELSMDTSAINQAIGKTNSLTVAHAEDSCNMQHYLDSNTKTLVNNPEHT